MVNANSGELIAHIEVTTALDGEAGYQERLRTFHLDQHGVAPLTGPKLSRNRATGEVPKVEADIVELNEARDLELNQIRQAIHRKAAKHYPPGTILVVEFRSLHFAEPEDQVLLDEFCGQIYSNVCSSFAELAVVDVPAAMAFRFPHRLRRPV